MCSQSAARPFLNPDFVVRSALDNATFKVNRSSMQNSEVFRDMFSVGDAYTSNEKDIVDIHETSAVLVVLLRLLHHPPAPPQLLPEDKSLVLKQIPKRRYDPATVIPLPLLQSLLYNLVDKYVLPDTVTKALDQHLQAHAPTFPLLVYGFAIEHGLSDTASESSQYLRSLASYTTNEIRVIPDVVAYHELVRLQAMRVQALRELVLKEDIFPHGYGACPTHEREATNLWERQRRILASMVETDTDISAEMEAVAETLPHGCKACHKACTAAVEMLAYKSRRVIKRVKELPT